VTVELSIYERAREIAYLASLEQKVKRLSKTIEGMDARSLNIQRGMLECFRVAALQARDLAHYETGKDRVRCKERAKCFTQAYDVVGQFLF
jgi:hypothetical protein